MNLVQLSFNRMKALARESDEPRKDLFKSITNEGLKKDFGLIDEKASTLEVGEEYQIQSYIQKIQSTIQNLIESYTNGNSSINESKDLLAKYNDLALYLNSKVKYGSLSIKEQNKINQELESIIPLVQELQFLAERLKISYASVYKQLYENLKMNMYKPITLTKETKDILISKTRGAYNIGGVENLIQKWDNNLMIINNISGAPEDAINIANAKNEFVADMSDAPEWNGEFYDIMFLVENVRGLIDRFNKSTDIKEKNDISQQIIQSKSDVESVVKMIESLRKQIEKEIRIRTFSERLALKKEEKTQNLAKNLLDANRNRMKIKKEEKRQRMEEEERKRKEEERERMEEERKRIEEEGKKKITNLIGKNIFRKRIITRAEKRRQDEEERQRIAEEASKTYKKQLELELMAKTDNLNKNKDRLREIQTNYIAKLTKTKTDGTPDLRYLPLDIKNEQKLLLQQATLLHSQARTLKMEIDNLDKPAMLEEPEPIMTTPSPLDFDKLDRFGRTASTSARRDLKKQLEFETPSTGDKTRPQYTRDDIKLFRSAIGVARRELEEKGIEATPESITKLVALRGIRPTIDIPIQKNRLMEVTTDEESGESGDDDDDEDDTNKLNKTGDGKPKGRKGRSKPRRKMAKQSKKQIEWRSKVKKFMHKNKCSMKEALIQLKK